MRRHTTAGMKTFAARRSWSVAESAALIQLGLAGQTTSFLPGTPPRTFLAPAPGKSCASIWSLVFVTLLKTVTIRGLPTAHAVYFSDTVQAVTSSLYKIL